MTRCTAMEKGKLYRFTRAGWAVSAQLYKEPDETSRILDVVKDNSVVLYIKSSHQPRALFHKIISGETVGYVIGFFHFVDPEDQ